MAACSFWLRKGIRAGETIDIEELLSSRDALTASILRAGGLLRYGIVQSGAARSARLSAPTDTIAEASDPATACREAEHNGPMTLGEKIIARHRSAAGEVSGKTLRWPPPVGEGDFVRPDWRYIVELYTGMATHMLGQAYGNGYSLVDPDSVIAFEDHLSYAHRGAAFRSGLMADFSGIERAHRAFVAAHPIRSHGYLPEGEGSEGICHPMVTERYALPGQLIVATDSHTPHSGAIGCLAYGVGTTDMANALVTGAARLTMPASLLVRLAGPVPAGVTAKDIVLHLLARPDIRAGVGVGKLFEFAGSAIADLSTDERATLTNMTAELGGFSGIVAPDGETQRFLETRRGLRIDLEDWMHSDADAVHAVTIDIDCSRLSPMVAAPGDPGNGIPLDSLDVRPSIDIAYGGSCTGGKRADFDQYHAVLSWAADRGLKVDARVTLYLQFGTTAVRDYCLERCYLDAFERVGATILQPSCGACANLGPGGSTTVDQVTVSAQNRNFLGREPLDRSRKRDRRNTDVL